MNEPVAQLNKTVDHLTEFGDLRWLSHVETCPACGLAAHSSPTSWSAETFGVLECDGHSVTGVVEYEVQPSED